MMYLQPKAAFVRVICMNMTESSHFWGERRVVADEPSVKSSCWCHSEMLQGTRAVTLVHLGYNRRNKLYKSPFLQAL